MTSSAFQSLPCNTEYITVATGIEDFSKMEDTCVSKWLNFIIIWLLGVAFSIDEMIKGFEGKHADNRHITYKREDDGFQADVLYQLTKSSCVLILHPKKILTEVCCLYICVSWFF